MNVLTNNAVILAIVIIVILVIVMNLDKIEMFDIPMIPKLPGVALDEAQESVNPVEPEIKMEKLPKKEKSNPFNVLEFDHSGDGDYKTQFEEKLDILADLPCNIGCPISDYTCDTGNVCITKKEKKIINKRAENRTVEY